jgi:hypothetical protein
MGKELVILRKTLLRIGLASVPMVFTVPGVAQTGGGRPSTPSTRPAVAGIKRETPPDLRGVYQLALSSATLPGALKSTGSPEDISLQPSAVATQKTRNPEEDGAKNCEPIGPFRMMAWVGNRIELLPSPGRITMLFENIALGYMRTVYLDRPHQANLPPLTVGDSIGYWDGDTLVVDTTNFNDYTWLNGAGAPHSDALHLIEKYRLVLGGEYLEVKVTAEDSKVLAKPYTYTRYYEKAKTEIHEDFCTDDLMRTD